jgi:hypothetical protein
MNIIKKIRFWLGWCPQARAGEFQVKRKNDPMVGYVERGGSFRKPTILHEERAPYSPAIKAFFLIILLVLSAETVLS